MTFSEARTIIRKHYDMWSAAAKLHEVLETAASAEAYLASAGEAVSASKERLRILDEEYTNKAEKYNAKLAELDKSVKDRATQLTTVSADAQAQEVAMNEAVRTHKAALVADLESAKISHAAAIQIMIKEGKDIQERLQAVRDEFAATKKKFSDLIQ